MKEEEIATPYYIIYEDKLRRNLDVIDRVRKEAGVNIIIALKANAVWRTFHIIRERFTDFTASSPNELQLGLDYLGGSAHSYCPVYTDGNIDMFLKGSSHITFNSPAQYERFRNHPLMKSVSPGLRVNPQCTVVETDIYNPALPGTRFGVTTEQLGSELPDGIEGFHFHALCESTSYDLQRVLEAFEEQFGQHIDKLKWINMGGGHLMTRKDYDTDHLISLLKGFKSRHPGAELILEPGSAFTWQTGDLVTTVMDVVENAGIKTAIIDASFACHMPDCLEMPYTPAIEGTTDADSGLPYRIGGNSCLSGDFMGPFHFPTPLHTGQRLRLLDMNHYTTVKTNMFNGIQHPSIVLSPTRGSDEAKILRSYSYEDYRDRMC